MSDKLQFVDVSLWDDKLKCVGQPNQRRRLDCAFKLHYCLPFQWNQNPHADS